MKFKCPQCETVYELPLQALPKPSGSTESPRKMRCVRCKCIFIMTAQIATSEESPFESNDEQKDVYFELVSPDNHPGIEFKGTGTISQPPMHRVRYELTEANEEDLKDTAVVKNTGSWSSASILDLSDYEMNSFHRSAKRKFGAFVVILSLFVVFVVYLAFMNNWSIAVNQLDVQVKRAFFLQTEQEKQDDLLGHLVVNLEKGYLLALKRGRRVGVVRGDIQNNNSVDVTNVMLEGQILNTKKEIVKTLSLPCGVFVTDKRLKKMTKRQIINFYKGKTHNHTCEIKSGYASGFKIVFYDLPGKFDGSFTFQVLPQSVSFLKRI